MASPLSDLERCPQCGASGDDVSTGPVTDGSEQTVCFICGWDTEHGTTTVQCRGGCGRWISKDLLCCDPCWARIPSRVPGFDRPWRIARRHARRTRATWYENLLAERATEAAKAWLVAHPARKKAGAR